VHAGLRREDPGQHRVAGGAPRSATTGLCKRLEVVDNSVPLTVEDVAGSGSGRQHLVRVPARPGHRELRRHDDPRCSDSGRAGNHAGGVEAPRRSRDCPSDRVTGFAQQLRPALWQPTGCGRSANTYGGTSRTSPASAGPSTDATDTLPSGQGVCRDITRGADPPHGRGGARTAHPALPEGGDLIYEPTSAESNRCSGGHDPCRCDHPARR
jgi:hypothetical protein